MPDHTCPQLSPVGGWCRLKANFKCPATTGRVGCPFPKIPNLNRRASEQPASQLEQVNIPMSAMRNPGFTHPVYAQVTERARGFDDLVKPFPASEIQWRVTSLSRDARRAFLKPGIGVRSIVDRLDDAVGSAGWSERYDTLPSGHVSCRLTVLGTHKEAISEHAEDIQEARSAAFQAVALKFGIARGLERVAGVWVDWDDENERPLETPVLPAWAVEQRFDVLQSRSLEPMFPTASPPSATLSEQRNQEKLIQDMIRAVRDLPGGEGALRRILRRHNRAASSNSSDKRTLYAELRRTYRELSPSGALEAA